MAGSKLNLGCGLDIKNGWINLDKSALPGVDVVHDLEQLPLPFPDNHFDEILCQDVLEHIEYIPVLRDLHRILKTGGSLAIRCPHFTSANNFIDPTHKKFFSFRTFEYFLKEKNSRPYYFDFAFSGLASSKIIFLKKGKRYAFNYLVELLVNRSFSAKEYYENSFLCSFFPAGNILAVLKK